MTNRKTIAITAVVTFLATCILNYFIPLDFNVTKETEILNIIEKKFNGAYDENKLTDYAAYAMVAALNDPYSSYLNSEDYSSFLSDLEATYEGVGIEIYVDPEDNLLTVLAPIEGSPGELAGILPGDKILKVDALDVNASNYNDAIRYMRGLSEEGKAVTEMTLLIKRGTEEFSAQVKRQVIEYKTVKYVDYTDVAYIKISAFDTPTSEDFAKVLSSLDTTKTKGIVLDLRDNPGGLLSSAVSISDMLLPEADIVSVEYKSGKRQSYKSNKSNIDLPFVVLINGSSASASEIVAGAVKDNLQNRIIGTKSFGKGCVQEVIPLNDGKSALKLTTALYYTPSGVCIHGVGIEPDIAVELPETAADKSIRMLSLEEDTQLQKAMAELRSQFK